VDPRFGKVGKQKCEDTGPLPKKRMETIDEEITKGSLDFMDKAHKDGKPFFVWWNSTRMHVFTHLKPASDGKTGLGIYADGMVEHDAMVGQLLGKLKELGIGNNTIVMYSTDNGAEVFTWPDGGSVAALRFNNWKVTFLRQNARGMHVWTHPFEELRAPSLTNLRMDPFELAEHEMAMGYQRWWAERMFAFAPAGGYVAKWLQSFREFPPRQKPGSFNLDKVMEAVMKGARDK